MAALEQRFGCDVHHRYKGMKHRALLKLCVGLFLNDEGGQEELVLIQASDSAYYLEYFLFHQKEACELSLRP